KYRDYVIRAFNADKPFDQFIREQLAGDEMVKPPYPELSPADLDKLVATGFLRMAPDATGAPGVDLKLARNQVVTDTVKVVCGSLPGSDGGLGQLPHPPLRPAPADGLLPPSGRARAGVRSDGVEAACRPAGVALHGRGQEEGGRDRSRRRQARQGPPQEA